MNIIKFGRIYCPRVRMIGVRIIEAQLYSDIIKTQFMIHVMVVLSDSPSNTPLGIL